MALLVGIENGTDKGFTENEIELINGYGMGVLAMVTGVGRIGGKCGFRGVDISVQEAHDRFALALEATHIFGDQEPVKKKMTLDFVQRMADADWSCNVSNEPMQQFLYKIAGQAMSNLLGRVGSKILGSYYHQTSWDALHDRKYGVRALIGTLLSEDDDEEWYLHENIDSLVCHFGFGHNEKFWNDKYLVHDEDTGRYTLADKPPSDEEE